MLESLLALAIGLGAAAADTASTPESEPPPSPVVHRLQEIVVRASPLHDLLSSQSVHLLTREAIRELPIDRFADALALKAGVVATGEDLHVRGGRTGDFQMLVGGIPLNEALRGRPMDLPLLAIESAELLDGGLDPEYGGALAGVAQVRTVRPGDRPEVEARWEGDGGWSSDYSLRTGYNRFSGRISGPLVRGLGAVASVDVLTDDTALPALRSRSGSGGWRADNRLLGFFKLAPQGAAPYALEVFASRRVERPFDPMWSLDGYTIPSDVTGTQGPAFSDSLQPGYSRYRAADHKTMTDDGRLAAVLSARRTLGPGNLRAAAGWVEMRRLVSVGGRDDESYLDPSRAPVFGLPESSLNDPFLIYQGDEPFFQKSSARTLTLRSDYDAAFASGSRQGLGAGVSYDQVRMREFDVTNRMTFFDSLRAYRAFAPGAFAYAQGRWVREGMVLNGGLRLEAFTAGPQAERQSFGRAARTIWTLSPRFGIAYPVSTRDVLSLSYTRVQQNPARDFLYDNRRYISQRKPLGNPELEPATVISYQVALKHLFDDGRALQVAMFYRDLFGQIGAREFRPQVVTIPRYENADKGNAQGYELGWILPFGEDLRLEAQYTFLHAVGTQSLEEGLPFGSRQAPRTESLGDYPLDWDRRHSLAVSGTWRHRPVTPALPPRNVLYRMLRWVRGTPSASWATRIGSGLPWTASPRNQPIDDLSIVNQQRFKWDELTSLALRWSPLLIRERLTLGLDVRNLFDYRSDRAATLSGYPQSLINTYYDDYGAFRGETGLPGGAYWDGRTRDPGDPTAWVRVHDPRLSNPPRMLRFSLNTTW